MDPQLQLLSMQLADTALRNTASSITDRITTARARKRDSETIDELEDIISELITDKNDSIRIAQAYEQQLVSQKISQEDIGYITETVVPSLRELIENSDSVEDPSSVEEVMRAVESLLSTEMVTVLQLLGFNVNRAIGEPLTDLVRSLVSSRVASSAEAAVELQRLSLQRDLAFFEIAQDEAAHSRLRQMQNGGDA